MSHHPALDQACSGVNLNRVFDGDGSSDQGQILERFEAAQSGCSTINAPCPGPCCQHCGTPFAHIDSVLIAVDGACRGNGRPDAIAACAVFFAPGSSLNETHLLAGDKRPPTSQRAELMGGIKALEAAKRLAAAPGELGYERLGQVVIKADSAYLVRGATEWVPKWEARGWKNAKGAPVINRDLFQRLEGSICELEHLGILVQFLHVSRLHNQRADAAANKALELVGEPRS